MAAQTSLQHFGQMQLMHHAMQQWDIINTLVLHYQVVWYHAPVLWNWFCLARLTRKMSSKGDT